MKRYFLAALLLLVLSALERTACAQSYSISWYKIGGGGGTSTNGQYALNGTVGQHDAGGPMTGGAYSVTGGFWALYTVQTPGAPTLFILKSGANAVLYWSAAATGFNLESNVNLTVPSAWGTVPGAPVVISGFNYVTNPLTTGNHFYRLHQP